MTLIRRNPVEELTENICDNICKYPESDYPTNAITIINIFLKYIVPEIRKYEEVK